MMPDQWVVVSEIALARPAAVGEFSARGAGTGP
jgi:hypothetical protein